jgi:glycosyltransferase involved in cell wall biosynthesis
MIRRVLIVSGNYPPHIVGGGEVATQILADGLADAGAHVHVLTIAAEEGLRSDGRVTVQSVLSPNLYWRFTHPHKTPAEKAVWQLLDNYNPRAVRLIAEVVRQFKPDVVLTSVLENFGTAGWIAAHRHGVPVVDIIHSYYLQCIKGSRFRNGRNCVSRCLECRLATIGKKHFSRYVDGAIGVSRHILEAYISDGYFSSARTTYIYNAIARCADQPRTDYRSATPSFGYLGKLLPTKGIADLVRIFSSGAINGRLVVAGDGEPHFEQQLRTHANSRHVSFRGWIKPEVLFDQIDFLIFPSVWHEPFGRGIVEAMAVGIPVIGASRGGIPEAIEHGRNGFVYDPSVAGELEHAIELAMTSDYEALSKSALKRSGAFLKPIIVRQLSDFLIAVTSSNAHKRVGRT